MSLSLKVIPTFPYQVPSGTLAVMTVSTEPNLLKTVSRLSPRPISKAGNYGKFIVDAYEKQNQTTQPILGFGEGQRTGLRTRGPLDGFHPLSYINTARYAIQSPTTIRRMHASISHVLEPQHHCLKKIK